MPKDAPLLRRWIKKSWSTSKKVGLWLGGIAVVLIAVYVAWIGLTSQIAAKIWAALTGWCGSIILGISNYIAAIPPLVFWGSVVVGAIIVGVLGYSLVWCMARNLQDYDWTSDTSTNTALAVVVVVVALAFTVVVVVALAFTAVVVVVALAFTAVVVVVALVAFTAVAALAFAFVDDKSSMWYYVFRFLGAYLNYRKRMKATPTTSVMGETEE
jgi:hypothetical protein